MSSFLFSSWKCRYLILVFYTFLSFVCCFVHHLIFFGVLLWRYKKLGGRSTIIRGALKATVFGNLWASPSKGSLLKYNSHRYLELLNSTTNITHEPISSILVFSWTDMNTHKLCGIGKHTLVFWHINVIVAQSNFEVWSWYYILW